MFDNCYYKVNDANEVVEYQRVVLHKTSEAWFTLGNSKHNRDLNAMTIWREFADTAKGQWCAEHAVDAKTDCRYDAEKLEYVYYMEGLLTSKDLTYFLLKFS